MAETQFTDLITNETLHRLERLRLQTSRRFANRHRGEHLAGRGGQSIEFSDYRDYSPGDDTRFVDWNIFARLQRPFVKLFHQEEEMHVVVMVDASTSMLFEGKLDRARQLAAAFGLLGIMAAERVSVWAFHAAGGAPVMLPPCRGRPSLRKIFRFVEGIEGGGDCPLEQGVAAVLKQHRGRGVAVILSDFLTAGDVGRSLNALTGAGLELLGVQILGPSELDPETGEDLRLVDAETGQTLDISSAPDLLDYYNEYRRAHTRLVESLVRQRGGRFLFLNAADPLESVLFDTLLRKGWVR